MPGGSGGGAKFDAVVVLHVAQAFGADNQAKLNCSSMEVPNRGICSSYGLTPYLLRKTFGMGFAIPNPKTPLRARAVSLTRSAVGGRGAATEALG